MNEPWEEWLGAPANCTIGTTASTINYTDSEVHTRGQTYEYRVQARKSTDAGSSPLSAAASIAIAHATPTAPAIPAFTNENAYAPYGYTVNWSGGSNGNTGAVTYKLWERVGTGSWVEQTSLDTPTTESYTGKSAATLYQYKVKACNTQNLCGPDSAIASISFPGIPGTITINTIEDFGRDFTLNWTAASGTTISGYKLERSVNGGGWTQLQDLNALLREVDNAIAGEAHQYRVRAYNSGAHGQFTSVFSYWIPLTPANVGGSTNTATPSLTLTWNRYNSAHHYELQQSTDNGQTWGSVISINNPASGNPSYSPASVANGTSYTYRVRACNTQNACSPYSANTTLRVPYVIPGTPAVPVINVNSGAGTLSVSWSAVSGAVHYYRLERREQGLTTWTLAEDSTDLSFGPASLDGGGKTYQFRVSACVNVDGCGTASGMVSAYLPHAAPPLPNLSASGFIGVIDNVPTYSGGYSGEYAITWSSAGGIVQSYAVQEQEPGGSWQAANLTALDNNCITSSNECGYNKPPNLSGAVKVYRYRAQACNSDNCSSGWKEIAVHVSYYPLPGVPASFTISQGPTNQGAYTLRWTRPSGSAELHYYYLDNSDTPTDPDYAAIPHDPNQAYFEQAFTGGVSGQTYNYRVRACYLDDNGCDAYTAPLAVYIPYSAPGQPGTPSHSGLNASTGSYTLNWSVASGQVSNYEVQRQLADGQWVAEATATSTSRAIAGHANGETRGYRVRACNVDACGTYSAAHAVYVPHLAPGIPGGLAMQNLDAVGQSLALAWTAPGTGGMAQNYEIQQSGDGGSTWQTAGNTASLMLTFAGLSNGTTYHFRLRACNVDACSAYTSSIQAYLPYAAPGIPGAISHNTDENNPSQGAFTVHWTAPASIDAAKAPVTHYLVDYSTNGGSIWQAAPTGGATPGRINFTNPAPNQPASATPSGLTTGASYGMRLRACNADACSVNTVPYQLYLPHPAPSAPNVLATNPSTADYEARRFTVQWAAPASGTVHHYQIEGYTGLIEGIPAWMSVAETPATSYIFTDRSYGETYRYRVRACSEPQSTLGAQSCSAWDESGDIRLKYPTPKKPGGVTVSALDQASGNYTLAWNGVLGWAPQYHYQLQQAPFGTTNWTAPTGSSGQWAQIDQTSHQINGQPAGKYIHRARACNPAPDNDCGEWSDVVGEVNILATPGLPGSLSASVRSCRMDFTWTPPSGTGEGQYRYELAIQNGGIWDGIAWTSGTSHTMPVMTQGTNFTFGVRVRSLSEGLYSAWSGWRTVNAVSAECNSNDYADNISIAAPQYSETGQYLVQMYTTTQQNIPYVFHRYDQWLGYWDSALGGVTSYSGEFQYYTVTYNSFNARSTGEYLYRFSVCTDNDAANPPSCMDQGATFQRIVTAATTVLRDPGAVDINTSGLPAPASQEYLIEGDEFTLSWTAVADTAPATLHYEIQRKAGTQDWDLLTTQTGTSLLVEIPEYGVGHNYRVRACSSYQGYVNCGDWEELPHPVKRFIGAPRFPINAYPADGELVIYSRQVPVQWLPPWDMADGGIHHYEISLREAGTTNGPKVLATPAPVNGENSDPPLQQASVEVEQGGQMEFMIRACGAISPASCGAALTFDITVVIPPEPPEAPAGPAGQVDPDPSNDPFNGALSGKFSVQPSGAATYSLPLILPPGTAGVQPKLSLDYSSQAGNGIAGLGWSIGGLSFISRCNKTPDQDGERHAVDYTSNDAYCLDGQRLIEIGTNQYRTELNGFRRIERKTGGVCGTWFEMKTQANETMQYGNTADSCINAKRNNPNNTTLDVVYGWALNRVTDVTGNYIDYKYEEDVAPGANAFALDYIAYTGHGGTGPYTAVDFQYDETRPDPVGGYQGGVGIKQARRLTRITTGVVPGNLGGDNPPGYGVYTLNYQDPQDYAESGDQISRVVSIGYCATVNTVEQCMEPVTFQWSPWQPGSKSLAGYGLPHPFIGAYPGPDLGGRMADLDNDGLPDLIYAGEEHYRGAYRNTGTGWQSWSTYAPPTGVDFVDEKERDLGVRLADITGDGKPELLTSIETSSGSGQYKVYRNDNGWVLDSQLALPEKFVQYRLDDAFDFDDDYYSDDGLRLVDLNADGLMDLIHGDPDGGRAAWRNTGSTPRWMPWSAYDPPVAFSFKRASMTDWPKNPPQGFEDDLYEPVAWFADFDGDGLQDLLYKHTLHFDIGTYLELLSYSVRLNTGTGWGPVARSFTATLDYGEHGPDAGINVVDLNGDGLPDLLRGNRDNDLILYNTGNSLWNETPFDATPVMQMVGGDNIWVSTIRRHFVDLNHDGRTDVLQGAGSWLSTETAPGGWKTVLEYRPAEFRIEVVDVNGDGRMDMLDSHGGKAWTQLGGRRQIVGATDALGNTTRVKYKTLTDKRLDGRSRPIYEPTGETMDTPYQQAMNVPMLVVDRVIVNDGIGGELTTEYAYKGLTAVIGGRGLQGFEEVTVISPKGEVSKTKYAHDFPYSGMPLEVEIRYGGDNGPFLNKTVNEYCFADSVVAEGSNFTSTSPDTACGTYNDGANVDDSLFVYLKKSTIKSYQLNNALTDETVEVTVITRNIYGAYGYLKESTVTTTNNENPDIFTTHTENAYDSAFDLNLGRLKTSEVAQTAPSGSSTRKTEFAYHPNGLLWKEIIEPARAAPEKLVTVHDYDDYGNKVETTVCAADSEFAACEANAGLPNLTSPGRSATTIYDSIGRYPISSINAIDQAETREYQHPLGLQTKLTGPNGLITTWQYDSLGRKTAEVTPFGTTTFDYYKASKNGYVFYGAYKVQTTPPTGAPARVYYDSLGRERRQLTQSLHGEWVAADTEYDRFGRVRRSSAPYFVYATTTGDTHWTVNYYDGLGRIDQVEVPLGDTNGDEADDGMAISTTDYQAFDTITTDPKGRNKLVRKNALGQTVRMVDDLNGLNVPVDYSYDSQGNLATTIVDGNAATTISITYDIRGNKTGMTDPDMGHWDYQYNGYGELVWQRDARLQVTTISYDKLGRMTGRVDDVTGSAETSAWVYDTAPGAGIGKLASETGPAGDTKEYSYTPLGLLYETEYQLNVNGWNEGFVVTHQHDAFGRVEFISYPTVGGERLVVQNVYSPFGGLWYVLDAGNPINTGDESVYWIADMVDARGKVIQETLRNQNIINNSTNAATGWLQKVESWDAELNMIQQTRYAFDEAGNVLSRERFRPWIVSPDGSYLPGENEEVNETFTYDSLDRLLSATVTRDGVQQSVKNFAYDNLGNFDYKDADTPQNQYGYNTCSAGPHAVCSAKGSSFTYDGNGNMIASAGAKARTIEYSAFNKPTEIIENGATVNFYYGADRSRIFKQSVANGVTQITWYVGLGPEGAPAYEQTATISGGQITKREHLHFIYAGGNHGGQPFAVRVVEEQEDNNASQPNLILYGGTEYYHRDHLGSVIAITYDSGSVRQTQLLSFDAWGKRRNADWSEGPPEPNVDPVDQYTTEGMRGNLAYTGHESVPEVGLIHMNGRVYDPELGVFLSADTFIQAASMSQNYNRYSYVLNNPIRYNDPSGHFVQFVIAAMIGVEAFQIAMAVVILYDACKQGGLKGFVLTAWSMMATFVIGQAFGDITSFGELVAKSVVHGIAQGIAGHAMGGDFRSGFTGAFVGSMVGPYTAKLDNPVLSTVVTAMVGGTVSELTGGKFRNGAKAAAIEHLFNQLIFGNGSSDGGSEHEGQCGVNMSCIDEEQRTAWVGGANDDDNKFAYDMFLEHGGPNDKYFEHWQGKDLAEWIDANQQYSLTVIGHSWGGDTAATVVSKGHFVDKLITVDPVGWTRPNFSRVARYAGTWINYNSKGTGITWNNFIATLGRAYNNAPEGYAKHFNVKFEHVDICYEYCKP